MSDPGRDAGGGGETGESDGAINGARPPLLELIDVHAAYGPFPGWPAGCCP